VHTGRWVTFALIWAGQCELERGDAPAALATLARAGRSLQQWGSFMFGTKLPALQVVAQVRCGRADEAADLQPLIESARRSELGYALVAGLAAQAERCLALHEPMAALACAEELLAQAEVRRLPRAAAQAKYWRARALAETARPARAPSAQAS